MLNIFGSGVATGQFTMGSTEPLGEQQEAETIDLDVDAPKTVLVTTPHKAPLERKPSLERGKEGCVKKMHNCLEV